MTKQMQILIIDCYGLLFRAYHSMPPLVNPDGVPVGAVYGVISMLLKILSEIPHTHVVVACDSGGKSFRHEIYNQYKAHRPPAPEDLIPQFDILRVAIKAMGLKSIELSGYEADDLIATFAYRAREKGLKSIVISSDKDLMQLVDDSHIVMFDAMKNIYIFSEQVKAKFGVFPSQILDFLSLIGDASDNIPGVPSIGPKTAAELLGNFGSLEEIYNNLDKIKQPKRREVLLNNKDLAFLSKKLVTLDSNVDYSFNLEDYKFDELQISSLLDFLEKNNFRSLINRISSYNKAVMPKTTSNITNNEKHNFVNIDNINMMKDVLHEINLSGVISILPFYDKNNKLKNLYLGVRNCVYVFSAEEVFWNIIERFLLELLNNNSLLKISYDIKSFARCLGSTNISAFEDVDLMLYILGKKRNNTCLINNIEDYLNIQNNEDEWVFCCANLIKLYKILKSKLAEEKLYTIYEDIDKPMINILLNMENSGVKIDKEILHNLSSIYSEEIAAIEKQIYAISEEEFNIGSPKQLSVILFQKLNLPTKNKSQTTDADILEELASQGHEIANYVLKWRHLAKLKNTYIDILPNFADSESRIHTKYLLTQTSTGRLSSVEPNLQNIPIKTNNGKQIRQAFIAKDGYKLIKADYSQIELRILSVMANVKSLIEAFNNGLDIHNITASTIYNTPIDKVTDDYRRKAKSINFGIIYGMSPFGLAKMINSSLEEAKSIIDIYFTKYPEIKDYINSTIAFAKINQYVSTIFGRKCYFNFENANHAERSFLERAAINAPIQGSQADIIKIAMKKITDILPQYQNTKMLLQIHDELIFETPNETAEEVANLVKKMMENCIPTINMNLKVDVNIQDSWL